MPTCENAKRRVLKNTRSPGCRSATATCVAEAAHVLRGARQRDAGHLLEHVADEPAAIEPRFRRVAAPLVADADQVERRGREVLRRVQRGRGGVLHRAWSRCPRTNGRPSPARRPAARRRRRTRRAARRRTGDGRGGRAPAHCPRFGAAGQARPRRRRHCAASRPARGALAAGGFARARRARAAFGIDDERPRELDAVAVGEPGVGRGAHAEPREPRASPGRVRSARRVRSGATASAIVAPGGSSTATTSCTLRRRPDDGDVHGRLG